MLKDKMVEDGRENVSMLMDELNQRASANGTVEETLVKEFQCYIENMNRSQNLLTAEDKLIRIKEKLVSYMGYDKVRHTAKKFFSAESAEFLKSSFNARETIDQAPNYWLSHALAFAAAWFTGDKDAANLHSEDAMRLDGKKASLFTALLYRSAGREKAANSWLAAHLSLSDKYRLDESTTAAIDGFAQGLFGIDGIDRPYRQLEKWIEEVSEGETAEGVVKLLSDYIIGCHESVSITGFKALKPATPDWDKLEELLVSSTCFCGAEKKLSEIIEMELPHTVTEKSLNRLLLSLCALPDDDEKILLNSEKLSRLIIQFEGDAQKAQKTFSESVPDDKSTPFVSFLITALKSKSTSSAKIAASLLRPLLEKACEKTGHNIFMATPRTVTVTLDDFSYSVKDSRDSDKLYDEYSNFLHRERAESMKKTKLTALDKAIFAGGVVAAIVGLILLFIQPITGVIVILIGAALIAKNYFDKLAIKNRYKSLADKQKNKQQAGEEALGAIVSEVDEVRAEIKSNLEKSKKLSEFISSICFDEGRVVAIREGERIG